MHTFRFTIAFLVILIVDSAILNAQWAQVLRQGGDVFAFTNSGTNLFSGSANDGIFRSSNNATSWTAANSGLDTRVHSLAVIGTNLFAGTLGGVFLSTNNGTSWTAVNSGLTNLAVYPLLVSGTNLFAGTNTGGVFLSMNNGTSWTAVNSGLTNLQVTALAASGVNLFVGTSGGGVFLSTNNGTSWNPVNSGLTNSLVFCLAIHGTNLFAGTLGSGIFRSTNNGTSWTAVNSGLTNLSPPTILSVNATNLLAGTWGGGVFLSTNNGTSWAAVNSGLARLNILSLGVSGTNLIVGNNDYPSGDTLNGVWRRPISEVITSVAPSSSDVPSDFALDQNYPNPFNPSTTISYRLPAQSHVTLQVYDVLGREVASLINKEEGPGFRSIPFDASALASGVYIYRLQAQGNNGEHFTQMKKLMLVK